MSDGYASCALAKSTLKPSVGQPSKRLKQHPEHHGSTVVICDNIKLNGASGKCFRLVTSMAAPGPALVQPVFLLSKSLPAVEEKDYSVAEICSAAEVTAGFETVEGARRIGGLLRL